MQVSERNGPICGYRIYLVRIGKHNKHMGTPVSLPVMSYQEAHAPNNTKSSAYIAEIFTNENFQAEVLLGDEHRLTRNMSLLSRMHNEQCRKLLSGYYVKTVQAKVVVTTVAPVPMATLDDESGGRIVISIFRYFLTIIECFAALRRSGSAASVHAKGTSQPCRQPHVRGQQDSQYEKSASSPECEQQHSH